MLCGFEVVVDFDVFDCLDVYECLGELVVEVVVLVYVGFEFWWKVVCEDFYDVVECVVVFFGVVDFCDYEC